MCVVVRKKCPTQLRGKLLARLLFGPDLGQEHAFRDEISRSPVQANQELFLARQLEETIDVQRLNESTRQRVHGMRFALPGRRFHGGDLARGSFGIAFA